MNLLPSLWAALAVLGFAMVFSVPRRTLPGIMALAVAAHMIRSAIMHSGGNLPTASFVAAFTIGVIAAIAAPRTNQATPIYAFAPVIPLIPGVYVFTALQGLMALTAAEVSGEVDEMVNTTMTSVATASLTVIALAVGTIAPGLLAGRQLARIGSIHAPKNISVLRMDDQVEDEQPEPDVQEEGLL